MAFLIEPPHTRLMCLRSTRTATGRDGRAANHWNRSTCDLPVSHSVTFSEYRVSGVSEFGAAVDEIFSRAGAIARWYTPFDRGELTMSARAMYAPLTGTPDAIRAHRCVQNHRRWWSATDSERKAIGAPGSRDRGTCGSRAGSFSCLRWRDSHSCLRWRGQALNAHRDYSLLVPAGFQLVEHGWEPSIPLLRVRQWRTPPSWRCTSGCCTNLPARCHLRNLCGRMRFAFRLRRGQVRGHERAGDGRLVG
jgi:hypothetical protein